MSPASSGTSAGMTGRWKAPVATTTLLASINPSEVFTVKPGRPTFLCTSVTSTPQRMGAEIFSA
jgi:hypothetical protein